MNRWMDDVNFVTPQTNHLIPTNATTHTISRYVSALMIVGGWFVRGGPPAGDQLGIHFTLHALRRERIGEGLLEKFRKQLARALAKSKQTLAY